MDSRYGVPSMGRGRGRHWRNDNKPTKAPQRQNVEKDSCNADTQNPFGITHEPWSLYQTSPSVLDEPLINDFKYASDDDDDDDSEEEGAVSFQQTLATKNVVNILSGTCRYLTDTDNLSTTTCGEAADQIFPPFGDPYNSFASMTTKPHRQAGAVATTSTDSVKHEKQSAYSLKSSPVNKLEEVSKCKKVPAPSYDVVSTKQSVKGFVAVCQFLDYVETGYGISQNDAREEAAIKMLKKLHIEDDSPSGYDNGVGHSFQYNVVKEEGQNSLQDKTQNEFKAPHLQESKLHFRRLGHCHRDQFQHKSDSGSQYPLPEFFLRPTGNKQYVWLLRSVASKLNFEVRYEIVQHRTSNCLAQCLVHLCRDPPIVCYGSAKSEHRAKSSAARCAFEYLKIVYQK